MNSILQYDYITVLSIHQLMEIFVISRIDFFFLFYSYIQLYQIVDFFSFILFATNQNS